MPGRSGRSIFRSAAAGKCQKAGSSIDLSLMESFCKNEDCPPSEVLLAFQNGEIETADAAPIRKHLAACEFCEAEVAFYSQYPPSDEEAVSPGEIPEPLSELAESILTRTRGDDFFDRLMGKVRSN